MAKPNKPNILALWGDDIVQFNVSAYNRGMMGYRTPNIDRIAAEGVMFTDWYGQQSCTAGRAAFITGQSLIRTGLTKVGLPGAPEGMKIQDPTIAGLLNNHGYRTGQFGKNHQGDRDECFRPITASMSSAETSTTCMPRRSRSIRTTQSIGISGLQEELRPARRHPQPFRWADQPPAGSFVGRWLQSFREFPPRQKPGSFNLDNVMEAVSAPHKGAN